jgi:type I restriction enzyme S subunit
MSFPRYPKYKPSGVEWLGEVPEHWGVMALKRLGRIRYGIGEPPAYRESGTPLIRATNIHSGKVETAGLVFVDPRDIPAQRIVFLREGDIIVVRSGAYTADSAIIPPEFEGAIAGFDMVFRADTSLHPKFAQYALLSGYVRVAQLELASSRAAQPHLNAEELGRCSVVFPPVSEQRAIAAFLDRETAKIDGLIAEQERLIELLKEKRQGVISHAVTKGLDPAAPMKPSGVEWLGEVPEHWRILPVGAVATVVNGYPFDSGAFNTEAGLPLVRIRDLGKCTTEVLYSGVPVRQAEISSQDVLIGMDGDFNVGRWRGDGVALLNQRMCCIRGESPSLTRLLEYLLPIPLDAINAVTFSTTVKHLSSSQVAKTRFAIPPPGEVTAILAFLDRETAKIDGLVNEAQSAITLLTERRSALISAAVTGQIDVRNAVPKEAA